MEQLQHNADYALFRRGDFVLHGGERSGIKIESVMDVLSRKKESVNARMDGR